jgi:hypothetical protein
LEAIGRKERPEAVAHVVDLYDELLVAIAGRQAEIGDRPLAVQWPHRGGTYRGTLILGQSVYGWADEWLAADFVSPATRRHVINTVRRRNTDRDDPMDWIATSDNRSSPFWGACKILAETMEPDAGGPWHSRIAWGNIYPIGPDAPADNPRGALREAENHVVGRLLRAVVEMLDPSRVIVFGGPYWEPAGRDSGLDALLPGRERPLLRAGVVDGRSWVVGWHPTGASYRRFGPPIYAGMVRDAVLQLEETLTLGEEGARQ